MSKCGVVSVETSRGALFGSWAQVLHHSSQHDASKRQETALPPAAHIWSFLPHPRFGAEKVGQRRVLLAIFGRVLCPPQPSCLPPLLAARALLLCPPPSCRPSRFSPISPPPPPPHLPSEGNVFEPDLSLCSLWPLTTPLLPVTLLSFLPKPSSSAHPLSPCFPFLSSFLCSFPCSYFLCFPFSPLSSRSRKLSHLGLFQCAGSTGRYAGTSLLIICAAWRARWQIH